jgi:hypothetical protein
LENFTQQAHFNGLTGLSEGLRGPFLRSLDHPSLTQFLLLRGI